jgi:hypothetical protein
MTGKFLRGEKPAGIAIEHPVFETIVNQKSAQRLGVTVPKQAIEQAVRIIR